jgi:hypothetical protein
LGILFAVPPDTMGHWKQIKTKNRIRPDAAMPSGFMIPPETGYYLRRFWRRGYLNDVWAFDLTNEVWLNITPGPQRGLTINDL